MKHKQKKKWHTKSTKRGKNTTWPAIEPSSALPSHTLHARKSKKKSKGVKREPNRRGRGENMGKLTGADGGEQEDRQAEVARPQVCLIREGNAGNKTEQTW